MSLACNHETTRGINFVERKVSNVAKAGGKKATQSAQPAKPSVSKSGAKRAPEATSNPKNPATGASKQSTPSRTKVKDVVAEPAKQPPLPAPPPASPAPPVVAQEVAQENVSEMDGVKLPAARGRAGTFGGPKDRSAKPDDKLALPTGLHFQYERYRSLNASHFYCAMRWDYRQNHMSAEEGKRWFANKKILVTNPRNGLAVVLRAVDYGPHEKTGMIISISPGAAEALGMAAEDEVTCEFADQKSRPGPVE